MRKKINTKPQLTRIDRAELRTPDGTVLETYEAVDGEVWTPAPGPDFEGSLWMIGGAGKKGGRPHEYAAVTWKRS